MSIGPRRQLPLLLAVLALGAAPVAGRAATTVLVGQGGGELLRFVTSTQVYGAQPLIFDWWTTDAGVLGADWDVEVAGAKTPIAHGTLRGSPTADSPGTFTLAAGAFLTAQPAGHPVVYTLHVTPRTAIGSGAPSAPATITEEISPPVSTGGFAASPSPQAPEPGHPTAELIAYRPVAFSAATGRWEGLVDLDFTNFAAAPTKAVFVRITDLQGVLRQSDPDVLVPPLGRGSHFRISVAMGPLLRASLLPGEEGVTGWLGRRGKGVSLQVTSAIGSSPYFQPQAKLVLTGPLATCIGDGCGATSPPVIANLRPACVSQPGLCIMDQSIAVGRKYIYTGNYNRFDVFDKASRAHVDLSHTALSDTSAAAKLARLHGGAATLFKDFWYPGSVHDLNPGALPSAWPIPCDPAQPAFADANGNGLLVNGVFETACIGAVYDTRTTFDAQRDRFWIVTNAGNELSPKQACGDFAPADCAEGRAEATRMILVAVSKSENPADGFFAYQVNNHYQDWPLMAVHGGAAFFFYHDADSMWVYGADSLARGVSLAFTPYPASAFPGDVIRFPKQHAINAVATSPLNTAVSFVLSAQGATLNANAFMATASRPTLLNAASYTDPDGDIFDPPYGEAGEPYPNAGYDNFQAVVRGPFLYVANADGERVVVWRLPMALSPDGRSVQIDASGVKKWILADTTGAGFHFDYSTIEVNANFDAVVSWRAWTPTTPNQVWFAVLYQGETAFRTPRVLSAPKTGGSGGRIDFVSSAIDPSDDETVWMMGADATGSIVGSVRP